MARPRKSTRDEWLDLFADFDIATQESLLDLCELIHRQAKRRAGRKPEPDAPVQVDLDTLLEQRQEVLRNGGAVLISGERKQ